MTISELLFKLKALLKLNRGQQVRIQYALFALGTFSVIEYKKAASYLKAGAMALLILICKWQRSNAKLWEMNTVASCLLPNL
jgi:hypothetical protein